MARKQQIEDHADEAADFLSALASAHRMKILCQLSDGEKCVTDLIEATGIPQTSMSQHLAKLKDEGIITFRREHRTLHYAIANPLALSVMAVLSDHYCKPRKNRP